MKIFVTGATGYVGRLVKVLVADGHQVTAITRDQRKAAALLPGVQLVEGDIGTPGAWTQSLTGMDAVIHLAGELIAGKRWTPEQKQRIRDSRIQTTTHLVNAMGRPRVFLAASAIDYYPFSNEPDVTESADPGDSFLSQLCRDWEAEAARAAALGVRVVRLRTGLVLGPESAVLKKLIPQFKAMLGGPLGSGEQWFSFVHVDDVVAAYRAALTDERIRGAINVVAPQPVRQREFAKALGKVLHRPAVVPTPAFAVRLAVGELADYALHGRKVMPRALLDLGFVFGRPTIEEALRP